MILKILGLAAATCAVPCLTCTIPQSEFYKIVEIGPEHRRNFDQQATALKSLNKSKGFPLGYKREPILKEVPYTKYVSDEFHMFVRISEVLIELLLNELCGYDQFTSKSIFSTKSHTNLNKLLEFLNKIGIRLASINFDTKGISSIVSNLTGGQKKKILREINLVELFGDVISKPQEKNELWKTFYNIMKRLSSTSFGVNKKDKKFFEPPPWQEIKQATKQWLKLFISLYHTKHITPYMHEFVEHLYEQYRDIGNIDFFNQQGAEKLNDKIKMLFFKSTNKNILHKKDFIKQIIEKQCRMDYLKFELNFQD